MKKIIISRTDSIGDVVLTLPVAGQIRRAFPQAEILFLGKSYTGPVIGLSGNVDRFLNLDDIRKLPPQEQVSFLRETGADAIFHMFPDPEVMRLARQARIPLRVATAGRLSSWRWCNRLVRFSRRRSLLHEAQLNFRLLSAIGLDEIPDLEAIPGLYGTREVFPLIPPGIPEGKKMIILHPRSRGSAREWGLDNYSALIALLPPEQYAVVISGTTEDGASMKEFLEEHMGRVTDITGMYSLPDFIRVIRGADALVAASTGPLHIAAALGIRAVGLYAPMRPIFPERWAPLGDKASFLVAGRQNCTDCRNNGQCHCIREITPRDVLHLISE